MESNLWIANTLLLGVTPPLSLCGLPERLLLSIKRVLGRQECKLSPGSCAQIKTAPVLELQAAGPSPRLEVTAGHSNVVSASCLKIHLMIFAGVQMQSH